MADHSEMLKRWALRSGYRYDNDELDAYKSISGACINIGAGNFSHSKWTNLDVSSDHYKSVQKDFVEYNLIEMKPMPFFDNSVALAYCSHTVEHVKDNHVQYMLEETYRVLKIGGVIRITCPNADLFYTAAKLNNWDAFTFRTKHWWIRHGIDLHNVNSMDYLVRAFAPRSNPNKQPLKISNPSFLQETERRFSEDDQEEFLDWLVDHVEFDVRYVAGHINWWNFNKLKKMLQGVGFSIVYPSTFGASIAAPMRNVQKFDNTVPEESIYVEAVK